jgi:TPR repeat protein
MEDEEEAMKWWNKAAEQGYGPAFNSIGSRYEYDHKDYSEAVKWYRKGAEVGDRNSQYDLGHCYEKGKGVKQDYIEALKWFTKAAEQELLHAKDGVNRVKTAISNDAITAYENGDHTSAAKLFGFLAETGDKQAQYNYGVCYHNGIGVQKSYEEAARWYRKAANQGDQKSKDIIA